MTAFLTSQGFKNFLEQSTFMVPFPPLPLPDSQGFDYETNKFRKRSSTTNMVL